MLTGPVTNRRSNAKTAYGLMSDIREYVLEEPKRVWMGDWIIKNMDWVKDDFGVEGPACGTVGCIAGNAAVLTGRLNRHIESTALEMLAGNNPELEDDLHNLFIDTDVDADYGTKKYALIVADRIAEFQRDHEEALRAVKITKRD